ncbi:MAG: GNAT family N-acetyltransferase [Promethearchaeota archaeon]|nr:MAG: GNAT family N-acetyltransferase [Candidatus Lokiarchaeota archaeon]
MSEEFISLYKLNQTDIEPASRVIARALFEDPLTSYYFPNENTRLEKSSLIFEYHLRYAILFGYAFASSENMEAIAVWRRPHYEFITPERQIKAGARKIINNFSKKFFVRVSPIDKVIINVHKEFAPFPHWYLSPLAVDPEYQGKGYASKLMQPMIAKCEREGFPIYLNTQVKRNVEIYKHLGFKVIDKTSLPQVNLPHWSLLKE